MKPGAKPVSFTSLVALHMYTLSTRMITQLTMINPTGWACKQAGILLSRLWG